MFLEVVVPCAFQHAGKHRIVTGHPGYFIEKNHCPLIVVNLSVKTQKGIIPIIGNGRIAMRLRRKLDREVLQFASVVKFGAWLDAFNLDEARPCPFGKLLNER